MKKEHVIIAVAFLAGVVLAPQVRKLPVLKSLPTA
jgi:hypothetical protein